MKEQLDAELQTAHSMIKARHKQLEEEMKSIGEKLNRFRQSLENQVQHIMGSEPAAAAASPGGSPSVKPGNSGWGTSREQEIEEEYLELLVFTICILYTMMLYKLRNMHLISNARALDKAKKKVTIMVFIVLAVFLFLSKYTGSIKEGTEAVMDTVEEMEVDVPSPTVEDVEMEEETEEMERLVQANTWVVLRGLEPGVRHHIQLCSKPDGTSMDGVWGPWPQALAAESPHSSGDTGLCCRTPYLRHVRCEWSWDPAEPHSSHQLLYRPPPSGAGTREDAWQQCEEVSRGAQGTYACTFQPKAGSAISVLVNVTRTHMLPTLSYFKEPFWLHQAAMLTDAPQLVQATVSQGRLSLQWLPPLELPAEQLGYQLGYAMENSHDWKVLQVPRAVRKEVLDLRPGSRYFAQVRAQPSGPWYRGSWSAGPKPVVVDAVANAGWLIPSVTVVPLLFSAALLGLCYTFPSLYSNMKPKLRPPVPELHRALGSFLQESSKHGQASHAFDKQPPEETVLPCLLEVLPGPQRKSGSKIQSYPTKAGGDCYIPKRSTLQMEMANFLLTKENDPAEDSPTKKVSMLLSYNCFNNRYSFLPLYRAVNNRFYQVGRRH
ncbi:thrombopoietin receptor-like [Passerculus sandwichensis]